MIKTKKEKEPEIFCRICGLFRENRDLEIYHEDHKGVIWVCKKKCKVPEIEFDTVS